MFNQILNIFVYGANTVQPNFKHFSLYIAGAAAARPVVLVYYSCMDLGMVSLGHHQSSMGNGQWNTVSGGQLINHDVILYLD